VNVNVGYACTDCGASNQKLWRLYQSFCPDVCCLRCLAKRQPNEDLSGLTEDGTVPHPFMVGENAPRVHAIGCYVPAVPVDGGDAYWGYSSVPDMELAWWKALPLDTPG